MRQLRGNEVLHIGLFKVVQAIGVIRQRRALRERDFALRQAGDVYRPAARVEAAEIGQRDGLVLALRLHHRLTSGHWLSASGQASVSPGMLRTML
ncbi:hypothetical protein D3C77_673270 [compost metagenome]